MPSGMRASGASRFSGLCLGLQCIVIEAARSAGIANANSAEFEPATTDPVISTMADQRDAIAGDADLGGTMRLGAYPATLEAGSIVAEAYQSTHVSERHRHRFEVNNEYRERIAASGLRFSGTSPDGHLRSSSSTPRHSSVPGRHAGASELKSRRLGRIRCSSLSSGPRWTTRRGNSFLSRFRIGTRTAWTISMAANISRTPSHRERSTFQSTQPVAEHDFETVGSYTVYSGRILALRTDDVIMPGGKVASRDIVELRSGRGGGGRRHWSWR